MNRKGGLGQWNEIFRQLAMLTQFGLTLLTPTLLCIGICYLLVAKLGLPPWVYLAGFLFGLGGSGSVAVKFYKATLRRESREEERRGKKISFNRHR